MHRDEGRSITVTVSGIVNRIDAKAQVSQIIPVIENGQCPNVALGMVKPEEVEMHTRNVQTDTCNKCEQAWASFVLDGVCEGTIQVDQDALAKHTRDPNNPSHCVCGGKFRIEVGGGVPGATKNVYHVRRKQDKIPMHVLKITWNSTGHGLEVRYAQQLIRENGGTARVIVPILGYYEKLQSDSRWSFGRTGEDWMIRAEIQPLTKRCTGTAEDHVLYEELNARLRKLGWKHFDEDLKQAGMPLEVVGTDDEHLVYYDITIRKRPLEM